MPSAMIPSAAYGRPIRRILTRWGPAHERADTDRQAPCWRPGVPGSRLDQLAPRQEHSIYRRVTRAQRGRNSGTPLRWLPNKSQATTLTSFPRSRRTGAKTAPRYLPADDGGPSCPPTSNGAFGQANERSSRDFVHPLSTPPKDSPGNAPSRCVRLRVHALSHLSSKRWTV
jgi:hypothetical protein